MSNDLKNKIASSAWLVAIVIGTIGFLIAKRAFEGYNWTFTAIIIGAIVVFVVLAVGSWLMASQVSDAYTLDAADNAQDVERLINKIKSKLGEVENPGMRKLIGDICKNSVALVNYTRSKQPNNMLSCVTVLEEWLKMIVSLQDQVLDVQENSQYHPDAKEKFAAAAKGFDGFNQYLLKSISSMLAGNSVAFENTAKMLDATRYNIM